MYMTHRLNIFTRSLIVCFFIVGHYWYMLNEFETENRNLLVKKMRNFMGLVGEL